MEILILIIAVGLVCLAVGILIGYVGRPLFDDQLHEAQSSQEATRRQLQRLAMEYETMTPFPASSSTERRL